VQKDYTDSIAEEKGNTKQWDFWLKPTKTRPFARVRNPAICGGLNSIKQAMNHSSLIELTDAANEELLAYFTEDVVHTRRELALARCALALAQLSEDKQ